MTTDRLVTIIIPVFNGASTLDDTVRSTLTQTWSNVEIIVIDDGSTDNSAVIAESFADSRVRVLRQPHRGAPTARNRGLREAKGDFIQYLDSDDLLAPDKIVIQMNRLSLEKLGTIASAEWDRFTTDMKTAAFPPGPDWRDYDEPLDWLLDAAHARAMMPSHAWLVPRAVAERAGPWNEELLINQDGEYFARILLESCKILFCPEARVYYRSGNANSVSGRTDHPALWSLYRSCELIGQSLHSAEDSPRTRRAIANHLRRVTIMAHPYVPELVDKLEEAIHSLGGSDLPPDGSMLFETLCHVLGWKIARSMQVAWRSRSNVA